MIVLRCIWARLLTTHRRTNSFKRRKSLVLVLFVKWAAAFFAVSIHSFCVTKNCRYKILVYFCASHFTISTSKTEIQRRILVDSSCHIKNNHCCSNRTFSLKLYSSAGARHDKTFRIEMISLSIRKFPLNIPANIHGLNLTKRKERDGIFR